jgi:hypothetical protein
MRAAVKSVATRQRKAAPANRGYGQPGVAKHDPAKHPRDANGRFITTGGAGKAPKAARTRKAAVPGKAAPPKKVGTPKQRKGLADQIRAARAAAKTPEARTTLLGAVRDLRAKRAEWKRGQGKTQVEKLPKEAKPKKVKEAKAKAEKPKKEKIQKEEKSAKLGVTEAVTKLREFHERGLSQKSDEIDSHIKDLSRLTTKDLKEVQKEFLGVNLGRTKGEMLAEIKGRLESTHFSRQRVQEIREIGTKKQLTEHEQLLKRVQARRDRLTRAGAKTQEEMSRIAGERQQQANEKRGTRAALARLKAEGKKGKPAKGDLRAHAESLLKLKPSEQKGKLVEFIERHKGPAADVKTHGMTAAERMHSIRYGEHTIHFPDTQAGKVAAAGTARGLLLGAPLHPEASRHTKNIYLTTQANSHDAHWEKRYNVKGFQSAATGGDGDVVVYHGAYLGSAGTFSHEAGHNLANARYGSTFPRSSGDFMKAAAKEGPPSQYATNSHAEDFAESVRLYTHDNAAFAKSSPRRHAVIKRMLEDPTYGG